MISISRGIALSVLGTGLLFSGCKTVQIPQPIVPEQAKDYSRPLPPGMAALRKITDPAQLPDFRTAYDVDREGLLAALDHSAHWFSLPSSQKYFPVQGLPEITHERAQASLGAFREILTTAHSGDELHSRILARFDVYESVGCDDKGTVLFTGYYTPIFDGSLTRTGEYLYPLYKQPPDLMKNAAGECLGRKLPDGSIVPYYTRKEIDAGAIKGEELVYLKDPFEAYVCTVQGSARLRLPDGTWFNIGYQANNGREYTSVGTLLVEAGLLPREQLSLAGLIQFFRQHPEKRDEYLPRNERYVFFQTGEATPLGSLGLPVTTNCTLATDKSIFPRGCLAFVDTQIPRATPGGDLVAEPWRHFALDQDTGGAIRAAGRADVYLGVGEEAGRIAGGTLHEGRLYYLFLK